MVGIDQLNASASEYFSVRWFSDWEGYGCVALRNIDAHTLIHFEEPFLRGPQVCQALDNHVNGIHKSDVDDKEYLKKLCHKSDEEIDHLWQLHDQYMHRYSDKSKKRLWGVISSNIFSNHEKNYQKRLYLTTSRFNHSCSPNLGYDFDDWRIRIYSLRNIQAGEVLCISYSDVIYFFPREKRRYYLLGALGFKCACDSCSDQFESTASDENRRRLKQIAIDLKHRLDSTVYSSEFCLQVNETAQRVSTKSNTQLTEAPANEEEKQLRREQLLERVRLRKLSKSIPIGQHDIDLIVEYISITKQENVDFDLLSVYRLAYDTCVKMSTSTFNPPKEYWAERYLELIRCAKGNDHAATKSFIKECANDKGCEYLTEWVHIEEEGRN